jgi:tetratricopeptide (TPR) repeat protein
MELSANLMLVNDTLEAITILKQCRTKYPDNETFYKRLSEIYAVIGKPGEALAEYDALIARDSSNFIAYLEKGLLQLQLMDTSGAQRALERSYSLQPITQTALALANIYSLRRDPRVLNLCDAVLAKDTTASITDAIFLKGIYYADTKQYNKAISAFNQCINKDWTFTDAYIEKGLVYYEQMKWQEALLNFEKATTVSSTNADAYYWLGRTYESMQRFEPARQNYLIALSLEPAFEEAALHLKAIKKDTLTVN